MSNELTVVHQPGHVYAAINQVTKALAHDGIGKDRRNEQQGFRFRGIDDVYNALAPELAAARLTILPRMVERSCEARTTNKGSVMYSVVVCAEFDFVSAVDGSSHTCRMYGEAMDSGDKATNKAMSAAYKYVCIETFCIPTQGEDNDADAKTPPPSQPRPARRPAPPSEEEMAASGIDTGGHPVGTQAAADAVAAKKLANAQAAKQALPPSFNMLQAFGEMKKAIGEKDYYRILGLNGFEKSNQIRSVDEGRRIYQQMANFKIEMEAEK